MTDQPPRKPASDRLRFYAGRVYLLPDVGTSSSADRSWPGDQMPSDWAAEADQPTRADAEDDDG